MAISATYVDGSTFTVSGDKTGEFVQDRRVKANCETDGDKYSSVKSSSYDGGSDATTVSLEDSVLTSNLVEVWFGMVAPGSTGSLPLHTHASGDQGGSLVVAYGVRWDSINDLYEPGFVQGNAFVGGNSELFVHNQMGRGLLTSSGSWSKLNPDDSTQYEDGSAATLDGSAGQVMVKIPVFYQLVLRDNQYVYFLVSDQPFSFKGASAWIPKGFYKGSSTASERYCGAFEAVAASDSTSATAKSIVKDTSGYSMSYPNPFTNRTRGDFRSQCSDGIFHQWGWGLWEIISVLFLTEYKTWYSQNVLPGYTWRSSWDYSYTYQVGQTTSLGDASGTITDGSNNVIANSFRGIENLYGHVWNWVDGINIDNTSGNVHVYTCYDPSSFADDTTTGYTDTGHAPGFGDTDDYIKDVLGQGELCPFFPSELGNGADSSSFVTDYMWNTSGAWRVLRVGGHLSNGALAGLAYLNAYGASSDSSAKFGARSAA